MKCSTGISGSKVKVETVSENVKLCGIKAFGVETSASIYDAPGKGISISVNGQGNPVLINLNNELYTHEVSGSWTKHDGLYK